MANLKVNTVSGIGTEGTVFDGGLKFRSKNYLTLPKGTTTERTATSSGISTEIGSIRYNTDSNKMECYVNNKWMIVSTSSPNLDGGVRGLFGGGSAPSSTDRIDFITISTAGNATDFGDLTVARQWVFGAASSSVRGVWAGGSSPLTDTIDFVTISITGNATDFGNLIDSKLAHAGCGNETRGLFGGGNPSNSTTKTDGIEFITIASTGNALDFGNLNAATASLTATASPTRGLFMGGYTPTALNTIQFVTIASTGNTQDFGDLSLARQEAAACANSTRAICFGGGPASAAQGSIDFFTIATLGNASNFGDLITTMQSAMGATSSPTRGVVTTGTGQSNTIEYIEIATQGDAVDFGDLSLTREIGAACSNGHGGL